MHTYCNFEKMYIVHQTKPIIVEKWTLISPDYAPNLEHISPYSIMQK